MGAALGMYFEEAICFYEKSKIRFGAVGTHKGRVKDLWKYRKIKSGENVSAVLLREYLIDLEMSIYIAAEEEKIINQVREAFLCPYYALTAGNSDSLLKIKKVDDISQAEIMSLNVFSNSVLPGDHANNYESNIDIKTVPLMKEIYAPQVYFLPTKFDFADNSRRVKERQNFTFIDTPITLKEPVKGLLAGNKAVALL